MINKDITINGIKFTKKELAKRDKKETNYCK